MPRKKIPVPNVVISRPQRNTRAKKVFDPSDTHVPKRRIKRSIKPLSNAKKLNDVAVNEISMPYESFEYSSNDLPTFLSSMSPMHSRSNSPESSYEVTDNCCLCLKTINLKDFLNCSICVFRVHRDCLIVNEPMWKFKLEKCPWLCKQCRQTYCSKCLKNATKTDSLRRCITCKVGMHVECYDSCEIKPLQSLKDDIYLCIPCKTLATRKLDEDDYDLDGSEYSLSITSEENDNDNNVDVILNDKPRSSSVVQSKCAENKLLFPQKGLDIPDVTEWDKYKVSAYLSKLLPDDDIASTLIKNEIDGRALLLITRSDITTRMGLLLGPALHLYQEIRILQTQSTHCSVYWE
ncbi:uncharacterized protein LOC126842981 [Adelges cooleyi]|uniref:uncharacterized protein LOC126842981 n=1 Tax=Adelges cooleyi TaxID=133065 RepID=UPI00217FE3A4|nr:uncharacterized protein LOC126842981 [Adelges cooleyi]XP_050436217.1 uncharacterized protein LOC126842981 [Adelges cooleyi]